MPELLRWLNGWVYALFGAEGLLIFRAHPLIYTGAVLAVLAAGLLWVAVRLRRLRRRLRLALGLAWSADGRRSLRHARHIRQGGQSLRQSIHRSISDRAERRALLGVLERFTRRELDQVLAHALHLLSQRDTPGEQRLHAEVERLQGEWSTERSEARREALERTIAGIRQGLDSVRRANRDCAEHLRGLAEAASAVQALERELGKLQRARERSLPAFRDRLSVTAQQVTALTQAYRELDERD